ncbi:hypothetical protein L6164_027578 [Bauhinia variegata]|uniref:Uncharacterized protein n=1 Tax=Bauhinia variegata TaxID=167791 RepID=A0ACB9LUA1_BAUVA|nr:hypothetical protein L6164_027578 [Bauhinia variegata]
MSELLQEDEGRDPKGDGPDSVCPAWGCTYLGSSRVSWHIQAVLLLLYCSLNYLRLGVSNCFGSFDHRRVCTPRFYDLAKGF